MAIGVGHTEVLQRTGIRGKRKRASESKKPKDEKVVCHIEEMLYYLY